MSSSPFSVFSSLFSPPRLSASPALSLFSRPSAPLSFSPPSLPPPAPSSSFAPSSLPALPSPPPLVSLSFPPPLASFSSSAALVPRIISYNVNSLSYYATSPDGRLRRSIISSTLRDFIVKCDIICLQETNLSASEKLALTALPRCSVSFNNFSMNVAGTLIIDTPSVSQFYSGTDVPLPSCCRGYIQLRRYLPKSVAYKAFQLFNIYFKTGPNKALIQTELVHSLLSVDASLPTFFAGDFNFIEQVDDSSNSSPSLPSAAFTSAFSSLKAHFSVAEVPHHEHTYFHITSDPTSPFSYSSRLDRFLIPSSLFLNPLSSPSASVFHHSSNFRPVPSGPRRSFSDHLPISLSFVTDSCDKRNLPSIPLWVASSPEFASALRDSWRPPSSVKCPFKLLSQFKAAFFRAASSARKSRLSCSSLSLSLSQHISLLRLVSSPSQDLPRISRLFSFNPSLRPLVSLSSGVWTDSGLGLAIGELVLSSSSSAPSPRLNPFSLLKSKLPSTKTRIGSLRLSPSDPPSSDDRGKAAVASAFWSDIWAARVSSPPSSEQDTFLASYSKTVDPALLSPPTLADILSAIKNSNDSSPGPDGIPFAAWRAAPDLAAPLLLSVIESLCGGQPPPSGYNHGLLFLIPKKHTGLASDTRPISVTNTDNRLLASTLARIIMPAVSAIVDPSQKGFLWGKNGMDHTADINQFFFEGVVAKTQRLLFFLDTAKAFDSIDHSWALKVLRKVGFPLWVTRFISSSLSDVKVAPSFGKNVSCWIDILRGVKQGCPLSPLIFILAYDPLLAALSTLPNIKLYAFADDLTLSALHVSAISPALSIISSFSLLSGLGINKSKSCVVSSGPDSSIPALLAEIATCPWPDIPLRTSTTHLGIPIGRDITLAEIFESPYKKALSRLASSSYVSSSFSVQTRVLFVNVFIVSLFSYHFLFFVLPSEYYRSLKELIRKTVTPFNGGAYSYSSLVSLHLLFSIRPPLKDLWAFNVSLLASRSSFISSSSNYSLLPSVSIRRSKFIRDHRDASAIDFWRDRHLEDGTLVHLPNPSSSAIYVALIRDNFLPEASTHCSSKLSSFISANQPLFLPPPPSCLLPVSSALAFAASSLPSSYLFHHFSFVNNALATSRRMRHQNLISKSDVPTCFFCALGQDSTVHLFSECLVINAARLAFLSTISLSAPFLSLFPLSSSPSFSLPLYFSFLISTPRFFVLPVLSFNFAVWKFRCPALGSLLEQPNSWRIARVAELAASLHDRARTRPKRKTIAPTPVFSQCVATRVLTTNVLPFRAISVAADVIRVAGLPTLNTNVPFSHEAKVASLVFPQVGRARGSNTCSYSDHESNSATFVIPQAVRVRGLNTNSFNFEARAVAFVLPQISRSRAINTFVPNACSVVASCALRSSRPRSGGFSSVFSTHSGSSGAVVPLVVRVRGPNTNVFNFETKAVTSVPSQTARSHVTISLSPDSCCFSAMDSPAHVSAPDPAVSTALLSTFVPPVAGALSLMRPPASAPPLRAAPYYSIFAASRATPLRCPVAVGAPPAPDPDPLRFDPEYSDCLDWKHCD